jgi:hypothetical protein
MAAAPIVSTSEAMRAKRRSVQADWQLENDWAKCPPPALGVDVPSLPPTLLPCNMLQLDTTRYSRRQCKAALFPDMGDWTVLSTPDGITPRCVHVRDRVRESEVWPRGCEHYDAQMRARAFARRASVQCGRG